MDIDFRPERPDTQLIEAMEAFEASFNQFWGPTEQETWEYVGLSNRPVSPDSL